MLTLPARQLWFYRRSLICHIGIKAVEGGQLEFPAPSPLERLRQLPVEIEWLNVLVNSIFEWFSV